MTGTCGSTAQDGAERRGSIAAHGRRHMIRRAARCSGRRRRGEGGRGRGEEGEKLAGGRKSCAGAVGDSGSDSDSVMQIRTVRRLAGLRARTNHGRPLSPAFLARLQLQNLFLIDVISPAQIHDDDDADHHHHHAHIQPPRHACPNRSAAPPRRAGRQCRHGHAQRPDACRHRRRHSHGHGAHRHERHARRRPRRRPRRPRPRGPHDRRERPPQVRPRKEHPPGLPPRAAQSPHSPPPHDAPQERLAQDLRTYPPEKKKKKRKKKRTPC